MVFRLMMNNFRKSVLALIVIALMGMDLRAQCPIVNSDFIINPNSSRDPHVANDGYYYLQYADEGLNSVDYAIQTANGVQLWATQTPQTNSILTNTGSIIGGNVTSAMSNAGISPITLTNGGGIAYEGMVYNDESDVPQTAGTPRRTVQLRITPDYVGFTSFNIEYDNCGLGNVGWPTSGSYTYASNIFSITGSYCAGPSSGNSVRDYTFFRTPIGSEPPRGSSVFASAVLTDANGCLETRHSYTITGHHLTEASFIRTYTCPTNESINGTCTSYSIVTVYGIGSRYYYTEYSKRNAGFFTTVPATSVANFTDNNRCTDDGRARVTCSRTISMFIIQGADLIVTKSCAQSTYAAGETISFDIDIVGDPGADAEEVTVVDLLPDGLVLTSYVASIGSYNPTNGEWYIPLLIEGGTATLTITALATETGTYTNTVTANYADEIDNSNNTASCEFFATGCNEGSYPKAICQYDITGSDPYCAGETGHTFSIPNVPGATYTWSVPTGYNITAGQGTNNITVDIGNVSGYVSVVIEVPAMGDFAAVTCESSELVTLEDFSPGEIKKN